MYLIEVKGSSKAHLLVCFTVGCHAISNFFAKKSSCSQETRDKKKQGVADHHKRTSKKTRVPSETVVANMVEDAKTEQVYFFCCRDPSRSENT